MRAGRLDRRLTISRRVETGRDDLNNPVFEWQTVRTVWAAKIHKSEDEAFAASQHYSKRTVTFRTRYFADVTETDRLEIDGAVYRITGIREIGRRAGLEISAEWTN